MVYSVTLYVYFKLVEYALPRIILTIKKTYPHRGSGARTENRTRDPVLTKDVLYR
jgi:hypothetical protein